MCLYNIISYYHDLRPLAGVLIIWDRMFGTFQPEGDKIYYGLVHNINRFNPLWAQVSV